MPQSIAQQAFQLFVATIGLEAMPYDDPRFHDLYSKECELFGLMRKFTPEDSEEYKRLLKEREMYKDTDPDLVNML